MMFPQLQVLLIGEDTAFNWTDKIRSLNVCEDDDGSLQAARAWRYSIELKKTPDIGHVYNIEPIKYSLDENDSETSRPVDS